LTSWKECSGPLPSNTHFAPLVLFLPAEGLRAFDHARFLLLRTAWTPAQSTSAAPALTATNPSTFTRTPLFTRLHWLLPMCPRSAISPKVTGRGTEHPAPCLGPRLLQRSYTAPSKLPAHPPEPPLTAFRIETDLIPSFISILLLSADSCADRGV